VTGRRAYRIGEVEQAECLHGHQMVLRGKHRRWVCPECQLAANRKWCRANRGRVREHWLRGQAKRLERDPEYQRRRAREWVAANPEKAAANTTRSLERARVAIASLKAEADFQCTDCGGVFESEPRRLHFHHVPGQGPKLFNVSAGGSRGYGKQRIRAEAAKCVLLCDSCHCRRTMAGETVAVAA